MECLLESWWSGIGGWKLVLQVKAESSASVWDLARDVNIIVNGTILGYLEE